MGAETLEKLLAAGVPGIVLVALVLFFRLVQTFTRLEGSLGEYLKSHQESSSDLRRIRRSLLRIERVNAEIVARFEAVNCDKGS